MGDIHHQLVVERGSPESQGFCAGGIQEADGEDLRATYASRVGTAEVLMQEDSGCHIWDRNPSKFTKGYYIITVWCHLPVYP